MTLLYDSKYHSALWQCTLHAHQTGGGHYFKCFHIHLRNSTHVNSSSEITLAYFTLHSSKPHSHWVEMLQQPMRWDVATSQWSSIGWRVV